MLGKLISGEEREGDGVKVQVNEGYGEESI